MASADGSIRIRTQVDTTGIKNGTKSIESGVQKMNNSFLKLAGTMATVFSVAAIINFGKASVKAASELTNAMIGLKSIVEGTGNSFQEANMFIQDYISDGLVPATNAVTAYKNLLMRGYSTEQIELVMEALKNSAAFGRSAALTYGYAVQSATEGLRNENSILVDNAGVTKNVSLMWKDYADQIGVGVQSLTKQQKIQAEVNGIMEETRFQMGDAEKITSQWSGQTAMLSAKWQQFLVLVGGRLIQVLTPVVRLLNTILTSAIAVGNAIAKIFGWETSIASTTGTTASNVSDTATSQEELANSTNSTNKALKKQLAFFDDINVLASESASAGSGSGTGSFVSTTTTQTGSATPIVDNTSAQMEKLKSLMQEFTDLFKSGFDIGFKNASSKLEKLGGYFTEIGKSASDIFNNKLVQLSFKNFIDSFVLNSGKIIGSVVGIAYETASSYVKGFSDFLANNKSTIETDIIELFSITSSIQDSIGNIFIQIGDLFDGFAEDYGAKIVENSLGIMYDVVTTMGGTFLEIINTSFDTIETALSEKKLVIQDLFNGIAGDIGNILGTIREKLKPLADTFSNFVEQNLKPLIESFGGFFGAIIEFVSMFYNEAIKPLVDLFAPALEFIVVPALENVIKFVGIVIDSITGFVEILTGILDFVTNVFQGDWESAWWAIAGVFETVFNSIGEVAKGVINTLIDGLNAFLNGFVTGINVVLGAVNKLSFTVPAWVPEIGGKSWGMDIPLVNKVSIPKLATGAVIPPNKEFMAVLGDQKSGTNIETPLQTMIDAFNTALSSRGGNNGGQVINLNVDGETIARVTLPYTFNEMNRQGYNTEVLGVI